MATGQLSSVIDFPRKATACRFACSSTDASLLGLFVSQRDQGAFETLVHRHRAMVLGLCQRILGNRHDAEDAFQTTFLA
jgi:hypothetical protein